ncbi:MAG: MarR family transcriptional regulator [Desulfovibrio sp.]|nr:MAG: MarR family transcriptional regulator [Desulfovibrio sp.]
MHTLDEYFRNCLFFAANALARTVARMAEKEFAGLGLSPSHAFTLMLILEKPGIPQKDIAQALHLAPSTVTRFVDLLQTRGLVERQTESRSSLVSPTQAGKDLGPAMEAAWKRLYERYSDILGKDTGEQLTSHIFSATQELEKEG